MKKLAVMLLALVVMGQIAMVFADASASQLLSAGQSISNPPTTYNAPSMVAIRVPHFYPPQKATN
jgi:hypothetical protein